MATLVNGLVLAPPAEIVRPARVSTVSVLLLVLAAICGVVMYWLKPDPLPYTSEALHPQPVFVHDRLALITPGQVLTAELTAYQDELFAYLMFDHLRSNPALGHSRLLLTFQPEASKPYRLVIRGQTDLLTAFADVASMRLPGKEASATWGLIPAARAEGLEQQTRIFVAAYNMPVRRKLEDLPQAAISAYLERFIRFKSNTDPRIRRQLEPVPRPLTAPDARRLAADILTVAHFYSLPLEFFLGIGAMENNYMDIRGDLQHSIWKKRPARDDVILERRRGRVRVLNDSAGVWQITRETLRYAHTLMAADKRDYMKLPQHLRPPTELFINEVSPQILTTYAGVLLRDLLNRFEGDVTLAVSAYNGGPARPNLKYGEGVHRAAAHARRVLEQSAVLNGESVVHTTWLRSP